MKKTITMMLALILALMMSIAVFAEETNANLPDLESEITAEATETTETTDSDETKLAEAWNAYYAAKQASSMSDYEAELKAMVEAGTLTQEQADLLLKDMQDRQALQNGQCPSCGYQFSTGTGKQGGRGQKGGHNKGMRGGFNTGMSMTSQDNSGMME